MQTGHADRLRIAFLRGLADTDRVLVAEWMTREPFYLEPDQPLSAAIEAMLRRSVRRLPVVQDQHVVGILTKSDVLMACPASLNPFSAAAPDTSTLTTPVRDAMSYQPLTIRSDAPLEIAAQLMIDRKIGGLPVLGADDHLVGILTESDLFRALTAALGGREAGLRITFDISQGEDAVWFAVGLARRHRLRLASVSTLIHEGRRRAIVRLVGREAPQLVDELWKTGHSVLSILRMEGPDT